jgi:hypothetical protein
LRSLDITFPEDVDVTRQNGQQYSFHFCHKVGVNRLSKEAGLIPHNENTPLRGGRFGIRKSDVDLAVPLASVRRRELARTRLP